MIVSGWGIQKQSWFFRILCEVNLHPYPCDIPLSYISLLHILYIFCISGESCVLFGCHRLDTYVSDVLHIWDMKYTGSVGRFLLIASLSLRLFYDFSSKSQIHLKGGLKQVLKGSQESKNSLYDGWMIRIHTSSVICIEWLAIQLIHSIDSYSRDITNDNWFYWLRSDVFCGNFHLISSHEI